MDRRTIWITQLDLERLVDAMRRQRARAGSGQHLAKLQTELDQAQVVESASIPADVITMHSTFELVDLETGKTEVYTMVFPEETDTTPEGLSVLAPVGTAALGFRVGDEFECEVPAGVRRLKVTRMLYQPEASGDCNR